MEEPFVIASYGVGGWYSAGAIRLAQTAAVYGLRGRVFTQHPSAWPTHEEQPYAFKMYAIEDTARETGCSRVLWLDAANYFVADPRPAITAIFAKKGCVLLRDGWCVWDWLSTENCDAWRNYVRSPLPAGLRTLYANTLGFDLSNPHQQDLIIRMKQYGQEGRFRDTTKNKVSPLGDTDLTHWQEQCLWTLLCEAYGFEAVEMRDGPVSLYPFRADCPIRARGMHAEDVAQWAFGGIPEEYVPSQK